MTTRGKFRPDSDHDHISEVAKRVRGHTRHLFREGATRREAVVWTAIIAQVALDSRFRDALARSTISEMTGLHPSDVTKTLKRLQDRGVIAWKPGGKGGRGDLSVVEIPSLPNEQGTAHLSGAGRDTGEGWQNASVREASEHHPPHQPQEELGDELYEHIEGLHGDEELIRTEGELRAAIEAARRQGKNPRLWSYDNGWQLGGRFSVSDLGDGRLALRRMKR